MSLIIPRNLNRAKAQDAAAQDIKLPFIITFNNGKKEFREGYSEEEVRRRFDKSVAALYGGIKSVKLEGEDKRDGKDSIADKEREYTRLYELAQKNITFHAAKGDSAKVAEWKRKADEYKRLAQEATDAAKARNAKDSIAADAKFKVGEKVKAKDPRWTGYQGHALGNEVYTVKKVDWDGTVKLDGFLDLWISPDSLVAADSRAADACGTDAKLQKGDKVRVWQYPVYGKYGEIVEATYGGMEYTVNVEGKDYPRIDYRRIVKASDAAGDATDFGEENAALEKIAKEYDRKIQSALADLKAFRMKASRYYPTCSYEIEEAIRNLTIVSEWCHHGAVYGFED